MRTPFVRKKIQNDYPLTANFPERSPARPSVSSATAAAASTSVWPVSPSEPQAGTLVTDTSIPAVFAAGDLIKSGIELWLIAK